MTERWQRWTDGRTDVGDNLFVHVGPFASTGKWLFEVVADDMAEYHEGEVRLTDSIFEASSETHAQAKARDLFAEWLVELSK